MTNRFTQLSTAECLAKLAAGNVGRVGWNTVDGPSIFPVNYTVLDNTVIFRTSAYGAMSELRHVRRVAFEIDDFDAVDRTGWSVLVRGESRAAARADELTRLWSQHDPEPWADGTRNLFIAITLNEVSGRLISR
jgi:uncharacterized protein